jgi:hypothetical protein
MMVLVCVVGASADDKSSASVSLDGFTHTQGILLPEGDNPYVSIELGPSHYFAARKDLGDLRITDSEGTHCPYIVDSARDLSESERRAYAAKAIAKSETKDGEVTITHLDYQVIDYAEGLEANFLEVSTSELQFSVRVEISARSSKSEWEHIATDTVYRIEGVERISIELPEMHLYQFWRVSAQAPLPLTDMLITLKLDRQKKEFRRFEKEAILPLSKSSSSMQGHSVYDLSNDDRLRLVALFFDPSGFFKRPFEIRSKETTLARKVLYRIPAKGSVVSDLLMAFPDQGVSDSLLSVVVRDGDDSPLDLPVVTARYAIDYVVFRPTGRPPYSLRYGNELLEAPQYDLESYRDEILSRDIPQASLSSPVITDASRASNGGGKTLFTVIVLATAAILGLISISAILRRKDAP